MSEEREPRRFAVHTSDILIHVLDFSWSVSAFLCRILDHLLCPDCRLAPDENDRMVGEDRSVSCLNFELTSVGCGSREGPAMG